MIAALFFLSVCIILLVMVSIVCALWDVMVGRWSNNEHRRNEQKDRHDFDGL